MIDPKTYALQRLALVDRKAVNMPFSLHTSESELRAMAALSLPAVTAEAVLAEKWEKSMTMSTKMTVGELVAQLQKLPQDSKIYIEGPSARLHQPRVNVTVTGCIVLLWQPEAPPMQSLPPARRFERERAAEFVEKLATATEGGYVASDSVAHVARLIRGVEHASWCQSKYKEPCNCGLDDEKLKCRHCKKPRDQHLLDEQGSTTRLLCSTPRAEKTYFEE